MPANTPTTTPALSPATHIVAGNTLNLQLGNVGLAMSWQIEDAGLGQTYTDGSAATFTSPNWYGFDEIPDGLFIVTSGNAHGNQPVGLRYSLLPKTDVDPSLGAGTEASKLIIIDFATPTIGGSSTKTNSGVAGADISCGSVAYNSIDQNDPPAYYKIIIPAGIVVTDWGGTTPTTGQFVGVGEVSDSSLHVLAAAAGVYVIQIFSSQDNAGTALSPAATLTVTVSAASTSRPSTVSIIAALIATGIIK